MIDNTQTSEMVRDQLGARTAGEHDALLAVIHRLERALAAAAPGRESSWARPVGAELLDVRAELERHRRSTESHDGLFNEIQRTAPWMAYRVGKLRAGHAAALDEVDRLLTGLERLEQGTDATFDTIRRRTATLLMGLRAHQAEEADLIFETFERDIGTVD